MSVYRASSGKSDPSDADTRQVTADAFFDGRLKIAQTRYGYRFSIDAVLLAAAVAPRAGQLVVDLGCGCGIIALILCLRHSDARFCAVELQPELAELTRMNVHANGFADRIQVLQTDMRQLTQTALGAPVDGIVCNPPYRHTGSGRINPDSQKARARHEIDLNLSGMTATAGRLLRSGGWLAVVYPAERLADLLAAMRAERIEPKWLQTIHSHENDPARLVMVQGVKAARPGIKIRAPIVIYQADGGYTPAVQAMMSLENGVDTSDRKSY